jgi:polyisoprenoid-binding protein YceI
MKANLKSIFLIAVISLCFISAVNAQKFATKTGKVSFFSQTTAERIEAQNNQVNSALDITNGNFVFKVLVRGFEFEKALMQEHFNENYLESDKFPNSIFKGKITNLQDINFAKDNKYPATIEGELTIHNVTRKVSLKGIIEVKSGDILADAKFNVLLKDYNIKVPNTVVNNISQSIEVNANVILKKLNN